MKHSEEKIRARAYAIWEREGRPEGREQEHWDEAARELGVDDAVGGAPATGMPHHENFVSGVEDEEPQPAVAPTGRAGKPKTAAKASEKTASTAEGPAAKPRAAKKPKAAG